MRSFPNRLKHQPVLHRPLRIKHLPPERRKMTKKDHAEYVAMMLARLELIYLLNRGFVI